MELCVKHGKWNGMEYGMEHVTDVTVVISQRCELIGVGVNWVKNPT